MQVFELSEMTALLDMSPIKAKNWTSGRPFKLAGSIRSASGTGRSNLFSIEDVYLMGLANKFSEAGFAAMAGWLAQGKLKAKEHIVKGLETFPDTLLKLFSGENFGKLIIQVADE